MVNLPPELTDFIIGFLDGHSLLVCALVCRGWLPACRFRSFNTLSIHPRPSALRLAAKLKSRKSTIAQHVRSVEIMLVPWWECFDALDVLEAIEPCLARLTSVTSLTLIRGRWCPIESKAYAASLRSFFGRIKDLTIESASFSSLDEFCGLIESFHGIESISMKLPSNDNISSQIIGERSPTFPSHLRVFKSHGSFLLPWLLSVAPHAPTLVEVCQIGPKGPDLSNVEDLIRILGPKLHKLSVGFGHVSLGAVFAIVFSIIQTFIFAPRTDQRLR
jgi:hypothetical protein